MLTADFDYHLPPELIASEPLLNRAASRMMVVHRDSGRIEHRQFADLPSFARAGDLFVFNDTRVVPARFFSPDGKREVLCLEAVTPLRWRCMIRPGKKFRLGDEVIIGDSTGRVIEVFENGERLIEWDQAPDEDKHGHLALPHYMNRDDRPDDRERYQTVFARHRGSIAAPTAGLHFTPEVMAALPHAFVTLHVGVGTFQPVKAEKVGTTASRTLESVAQKHGRVVADQGETSIFIYPGYQFKAVNALLTNFHLPKSSLIMLVSALAGTGLIRQAYAEAVREKYRFFSYGDCMLIV